MIQWEVREVTAPDSGGEWWVINIIQQEVREVTALDGGGEWWVFNILQCSVQSESYPHKLV